MAINPKRVLDTAFSVGKGAVSAVGRRLHRPGEPPVTSSPTSVGAAKPGKPRGPKSATAAATKPRKSKPAKRRAPAKRKAPPKPVSDKTSTPRKRATGRRSTASRAAAASGGDVADAASGKDD